MPNYNHFVVSNITKRHSTAVSKICIFAESLSDTGNLYKYTFGLIPKSPPFWRGRFCNGPVWVDHYTDYYATKRISVENYSASGAVCYLKNPFRGFVPFTAYNTIRSYKLRHRNAKHNKVLFIIWFGGNDYFQGMSEYDYCTTRVVQTIESMADDLISLGAENFMFVNQPDFTLTPAHRVNNYPNLKNLIIAHNNKLEQMALKLIHKYPKIRVSFFNIFNIFQFLVNDLEAFNKHYGTKIKNTTTPYWAKLFTHGVSTMAGFDELAIKLRQESNPEWVGFDLHQTLEFLKNNPDVQEAMILSDRMRYEVHALTSDDPDEFVFWDRAHATKVIQKVISEEFIKFTDESFKFEN